MPKYSAPVAVADVLVVFGTATMNSAAVGNGIGNVAVRDEQYPHCFTRPQGRYKVYRRNSCSNNQKRLLLMSNLRDDNDRYFQWCCCERYLQRHNTL